ncbi:MAG: hypothetical protein Q8O99_01845 [bacterium]|nr:hypothetical protein [bacterium]
MNNYPIFLQRDSFDIAADYNNCEAALNMPYEEFLALLKIFTSTVKNGLPKKVWCLRT